MDLTLCLGLILIIPILRNISSVYIFKIIQTNASKFQENFTDFSVLYPYYGDGCIRFKL